MLTGNIYQYNRWAEFSFYSTFDGTDGTLNETFDSSVFGKAKRFRLKEIRFHLSSLFVSVEYFKVYISSRLGSNFNYILISQLMSGIMDYRATWEGAEEFLFDSDDHLNFQLSCKSGLNLYGLQVNGWAIEA